MALVNPADRPGVIQVKKRTHIKDRVYKQMGLGNQQNQMAYTNNSIMNNNSAMMSYMQQDHILS